MEIKRIIVDELPTSCIKCNLYIDVDFSPYCPVLSRKFNLENEGYAARLDDCILQVEDECVWEEDDEFIYNYWTGCNTLIDGVGYKFCPNCGKRIRYEEE